MSVVGAVKEFLTEQEYIKSAEVIDESESLLERGIIDSVYFFVASEPGSRVHQKRRGKSHRLTAADVPGYGSVAIFVCVSDQVHYHIIGGISLGPQFAARFDTVGRVYPEHNHRMTAIGMGDLRSLPQGCLITGEIVEIV